MRAQAAVGGATVTASCTPRMEIQDMASDKSVALAALPPELVSSCKIIADESGFHRPFLRDAECSKVYGPLVAPMVGKTLPFERTQGCRAEVGGTTIFQGTFVYQ